MITSTRSLLDRLLRPDDPQSEQAADDALKLAVAALLVEVVQAEFETSIVEREQVLDSLALLLELDADARVALLELASREIDQAHDVVINKRMASAFFETNLGSLFTFHRVDTVVVTGGSTSGCVRATVVDSLSRSFRTVVPEECVADKHESPHFANVYDMALKYADVLPVSEVLAFMDQYESDN